MITGISERMIRLKGMTITTTATIPIARDEVRSSGALIFDRLYFETSVTLTLISLILSMNSSGVRVWLLTQTHAFESGEIYKKINKNIICISLYQKGNQFIFMKMQIYMKERYIFLGLSSETYKVRYCVMDLQNCKRKVIWFFKIELKKYLHINKFGTMGVFVSVGVGISECQSEDSFIRFGAKATQTACSRDFLQDWKKTRKGNVPGQSTEESSQQKRAINRSQGKVTVRKRRLPSEELRPVNLEAWSANARGWVSVPGGCVGILLGYTLTISRCTENHTKVSQTSPFLRLELTQVRACLFFFSSTLSVVYVVSCMFVK